MSHIPTEKPKSVRLQDYVGKPVIIEPLQLADKKPEWKSAPWAILLWVDDGEGYQANEMLVFAKAITDNLPLAKKSGGWLGGVLAKEGSQFWIDSSNALIMRALESEWLNISGNNKDQKNDEEPF